MGPRTGVVADLAAIRIAQRGFGYDVRAVKVIFQREILRMVRERARGVTVLFQPLLWLFVMGTGMSSLTVAGTGSPDVDFRVFLFPGILAMTVIFPAIFSGASIVWDREFGFLREIMVAPVSRTSIVVGKCLGGTATATLQGTLLLCLAGLVGVPYAPGLLLTLVLEMMLLAFCVTTLGVLLATRIQTGQSFNSIFQLGVMPMFFLSGAMFPMANLPTWLGVLTHINPLAYAVNPMRQAVLNHVNLTPHAHALLNPSMTWRTWQVPVGLQLTIVAAMAAIMLAAAIKLFRRGPS